VKRFACQWRQEDQKRLQLPWSCCLYRALYCRQNGPLFCRCETAIDKRFANIDFTALTQILGQLGENLFKYAISGPFWEPAMAGLIGRIPWRYIFPRCAGAQDPKDAVDNILGFAWGRPRPSALLLGDIIKCFSRAHCSFVRFIPSICNIFKQGFIFYFNLFDSEKAFVFFLR
jgi:hypothetical protein